jgi:hypothetical protein
MTVTPSCHMEWPDGSCKMLLTSLSSPSVDEPLKLVNSVSLPQKSETARTGIGVTKGSPNGRFLETESKKELMLVEIILSNP